MRAGLAAALALLLTAGAALAGPAGTVVGLSGTCSVIRAGVRDALALGVALQESDTVEVPAGGKLKLRMTDGSVIALAAGTTMTIATYAANESGRRQDAVLSLGRGLLHAIVSPSESAGRFEVRTAIGSAGVRSTDWFIETNPQGDEITVLSGSVAVTSAATGRSVVVPPYRTTRLVLGREPLPPRIVNRAALERIIGRTEARPFRHEPHPSGRGALHERGSRRGPGHNERVLGREHRRVEKPLETRNHGPVPGGEGRRHR